jgi:subtilase family serine protease
VFFSRLSLGRDSGRNKQARRRRGHAKDNRTLRVEPLENRCLLSVSLPGYAVPDHVAPFGVTPMATAGSTGLTPAQVRTAYGFDKISFNSGTVAADGTGTTIAIVDAYNDPNIANDLHQFDAAFGLPDPTFTKVSQTGSTTALPANNAGWATEIALDVEWAHAIAPKANILLVEANSSSMSDLMSAVNYARNASGVVAVSLSWGGGEFSGESSYDSYFTTPSGHSGVTFIASSGDSGAPVSYPAASPNVLSVGGTTLYRNAQGGYSSEAGWSGSGGGISRYEAQPTYQKGTVTQSSTYRTNPDVAYDSNPSSGFSVYDSYNNGTAKPWGQWGGTSDAAPQWAALIAIADEGRALAGKTALNGPTQTLPMLYALSAADFHDVSSGTSTG